MLLTSCTGQALTSLARLDAERLIASSSTGSMSNVDHELWVRCRSMGGRGVLNPLITMLPHGVTGRSRNGHLPAKTAPSMVTAAAWSPCGTRLVSTSTDRSVMLWDAECGRLLNILDGHTDAVLCVEWSPDRNLLATGSKDKTAILWDMKSSLSPTSSLSSSSLPTADGGTGPGPGPPIGVKRCVLRGHKGAVTALSWSPDSWIIATGSADHRIFLWHVINGGEDVRITSELLGYTNTMEGHCWTVNSVHYNPKGTLSFSSARSSYSNTPPLTVTLTLPSLSLSPHSHPIKALNCSLDLRITSYVCGACTMENRLTLLRIIRKRYGTPSHHNSLLSREQNNFLTLKPPPTHPTTLSLPQLPIPPLDTPLNTPSYTPPNHLQHPL